MGRRRPLALRMTTVWSTSALIGGFLSDQCRWRRIRRSEVCLRHRFVLHGGSKTRRFRSPQVRHLTFGCLLTLWRSPLVSCGPGATTTRPQLLGPIQRSGKLASL